jgi:hypothetical protein
MIHPDFLYAHTLVEDPTGEKAFLHDEECQGCAMLRCPYKDPNHLHHDGCPSCRDGMFVRTCPYCRGHDLVRYDDFANFFHLPCVNCGFAVLPRKPMTHVSTVLCPTCDGYGWTEKAISSHNLPCPKRPDGTYTCGHCGGIGNIGGYLRPPPLMMNPHRIRIRAREARQKAQP